MQEAQTLRAALALRSHEIVAIVGGGGKTTILYRLASETAASGGRSIVTGTTRFTPPERGPRPPLVFAETEAELVDRLRAALAQTPVVVAGTGWGNKGRIMPVEPGWLTALAALPGVAAVVAESDGSAGRPFKAPAEHEPVVAPSTTLLLSVTGIDVLGRPLLPETVHRPEIVAALTGAALGDPVDEALIARVLLSEAGGRKGLPPGARWIPVINKVESAEEQQAARRIAERLIAGGAAHAIIARAGREPPVVDVVASVRRSA